MASLPHPLALADLKGFHDNKHLSDVTICFSGRKFRGHRIVLCLASDYFQMTFNGRFLESKSNEIELKEDDPDAVAGVLRYIYGLDPFEAVAAPGIYFDFRLYETSGKYLLPRLQRKAAASAKKKLEEKWDTPSFPDYVYSIYQHTATHSGDLRDIAKTICRDHLPALMARKKFKEVLLEIPELSLDIMQLVAKQETMNRDSY
ncbi:uncharacterized protein MYCFIDRAFT_41757 [Pseudocercospora fijiensis CIRAD86]|uniref:BTB domain-containing protein n=1 Tax=Pseudocercospora fijiensis (strain CIRAD86) TaxID=383855 RepID=M3B5U4_PSEFD|nr:uncharacterized protein MYCFIDRAFT_41757 [Pseudocercospora fijiensis CIRAD86]EME84732.1 hypothetical protein MYCFIDRAFT_41757 [Pseudocercospora fijiensis CIRAD86]